LKTILRVLRVLVPSAAVIAASLSAGSNAALAYGAADQPLAQLEFSGNCNNPSFPLCFPPQPDGSGGVGLGGIWLWVEVDANNTGDIAGAGCGHVRGVGGGAGSISGDITWTYGNGAAVAAAHAFPLGVDPHNLYYIVALNPFEKFAWPTTVGHYSSHPAPAVALEAQTAP
jgi:hypothetical protein